MSNVILNKVRYSRTIAEKKESAWSVCMYTTREFSEFPNEVKKNAKGNTCYFFASGVYLPMVEHTNIVFSGFWKKSKFGMQFSVTNFQIKDPETKEEMASFLAAAVKGIGKKTAASIVEAFGMDALNVLRSNPNKLLTVKGIGERNIRMVMESDALKKGYSELSLFLSKYGIQDERVSAVYKKFEEESTEKLKANPFILMDVPGFGFITADRIAADVGIDPCSSSRLIASLKAALKWLSSSTGDMFSYRRETVEAALKMLNTESKAGKTPVPQALVEEAFEEAVRSKVIIYKFPESWGLVYLPEMESAEIDVAEVVAELVSHNGLDKALMEAVEIEKADVTFPLTNGQNRAITAIAENRISIITGGAGTGKTTVAKKVIKAWRRAHPNMNVTLLAPTGKAARRLTEATGEPATTIHSALKMDTGEGETLKFRETLPKGLIVVDEASMVDNFVAQSLFKACDPESTVVILGDINQLPSVGAGCVLAELIRSKVVHVTYLDQIMRQGKDSSIIGNSHLINEGSYGLQWDEWFQMIPANTENAAEVVLRTYLQECATYGAENVVILSPLKKWGPVCANSLNKLVQETLDPHDGRASAVVHETRFRVGDRVIQLKNNDDASNGDVGVLTAIEDTEEGQRFFISFEGDINVSYSRKEMAYVDLAYALTIHKSQGSEYKSVIIPILSEYECPLYKRNLLYTGVTRAKEKVILISNQNGKAINTCIAHADTGIRKSCLAVRIYQDVAKNSK